MNTYDALLTVDGVLITLLLLTTVFTERQYVAYIIAVCLIATTGVALFVLSPTHS